MTTTGAAFAVPLISLIIALSARPSRRALSFGRIASVKREREACREGI
jgi:hypothetical protein